MTKPKLIHQQFTLAKSFSASVIKPLKMLVFGIVLGIYLIPKALKIFWIIYWPGYWVFLFFTKDAGWTELIAGGLLYILGYGFLSRVFPNPLFIEEGGTRTNVQKPPQKAGVSRIAKLIIKTWILK